MDAEFAGTYSIAEAKVVERMRFGWHVPNYGPYGDPWVLRDLAVAAEGSGWDGFFLYDLIGPHDFDPPVADPWVALAAIAQATSTIRLGPLVTPVPRRRPWKLAAEAATLQMLSEGRLVLGVGAGVGWDYARFGESAAGRELAGRLDEGTALVRALLSGEPVEHDGQYYRGVRARMPPAQVPIWTSGFWPRTVPVRAASSADGIFPQIRDPEQDFRLPTPTELERIRADFAEAAGRMDGDAGDVVIWSPYADPSAEQVPGYAAAGVTWWLANAADVAPEEVRRRIELGPPA